MLSKSNFTSKIRLRKLINMLIKKMYNEKEKREKMQQGSVL